MNKGLDKLNVENLEAVNGGTNQSARPDSTVKTFKRAEKLGIGKKNVTASQLIPGTPAQASNLGVASNQESRLDSRVQLNLFPENMA